MDSTIAAAWITGGVGALGIMGTVAATVVGSRNTKRATEATGAATTTATLAAAREDRLWEKQCAAYETMLEALLYRQRKREHDLRMYRLDEDSRRSSKNSSTATTHRAGSRHGLA